MGVVSVLFSANSGQIFQSPSWKTLKLCWNMIYFFIHEKNANSAERINKRRHWIMPRLEILCLYLRRFGDVLLTDRNCRISLRLVIAEWFVQVTQLVRPLLRFSFPFARMSSGSVKQKSFCAKFSADALSSTRFNSAHSSSQKSTKNFPLTGHDLS